MYYNYFIATENYQSREISKEVVEYSQDLKRSLFSSIKRYARIAGFREDRELRRVEELLKQNYTLFVLRPKTQIKGWIWISPEGHVEDWYVFKNYRKQLWCEEMVYATLNCSDNEVTFAVNSQDSYLLQTLDSVLEKICCRAQIVKVE